jgi:hypothetical protein
VAVARIAVAWYGGSKGLVAAAVGHGSSRRLVVGSSMYSRSMAWQHFHLLQLWLHNLHGSSKRLVAGCSMQCCATLAVALHGSSSSMRLVSGCSIARWQQELGGGLQHDSSRRLVPGFACILRLLLSGAAAASAGSSAAAMRPRVIQSNIRRAFYADLLLVVLCAVDTPY